VTGSVQEVDGRRGTLREAVSVDLTSLTSVHVLNTHTDVQSFGQSRNVDVIALSVHGVNLLQY